MIILNPIHFALLPFINGYFFKNTQDRFQIKRLEMFYPSTLICRFFGASQMSLQSVLGIVALANVTYLIRSRISEGINEGRIRVGLALRDIFRYDVVHDGSQLLLSSRLGVLQHRSGTTLLPPQYTMNPLYRQVHSISTCLFTWHFYSFQLMSLSIESEQPDGCI